jgi:hypothetical protein
MSQNFLMCDREQSLLLPLSFREWLAEDHLAWFVLDVVEELDLAAFYAGYRRDGWGRAARGKPPHPSRHQTDAPSHRHRQPEKPSRHPPTRLRDSLYKAYIEACGAIAQLGERLLCKQEVAGSIPAGSIKGNTCK